MPHRRAVSGRARSRRVIATALAAACVLASSLLAGCGATSAPSPSLVAVSWADAHRRSVTPTPTPNPDGRAAQNAALGCAGAAPAPQSVVLYSGQRPGATTPAPKEVALTFDDGPTPYSSPPIYDVLERWHAPATFFDEGQFVTLWPHLLQREWKDGFAIAVHTWDHPEMTTQTPDGLRHQFGDTLAAIHKILGADACVWLWRPPYGDYNHLVVRTADSYGLTTITWDTSSNDWTRPGAAVIVQNVLGLAHPGSVILMHDGPAFREQTAAALPYILQGLLARGLTPVTLPRLLADAGYPGVSVPPAPLPTLTPQTPLPPLPTPEPTQPPTPSPSPTQPTATPTAHPTATP